MRHARWLAFGSLAVAFLLPPTLGNAFEDLTLEALPPAARDALVRLAGDARITEVEQEGEGLYEAEWKVGGREHEAVVTADGTLVELEEEIEPAAAPPAVRQLIAERFGPDAAVEVERLTVYLYEIEGRGVELIVTPTGQVRGSEADDEDDELDDD